MVKEKKEGFKYQDIAKVRIPNEDMPGWIQSLREGGFTDQEIDMILSNLNVDYRKAKNPNFVEEELGKLMKYFREKYKKILNPKEIEHLKKGIESRLED